MIFFHFITRYDAMKKTLLVVTDVELFGCAGVQLNKKIVFYDWNNPTALISIYRYFRSQLLLSLVLTIHPLDGGHYHLGSNLLPLFVIHGAVSREQTPKVQNYMPGEFHLGQRQLTHQTLRRYFKIDVIPFLNLALKKIECLLLASQLFIPNFVANGLDF